MKILNSQKYGDIGIFYENTNALSDGQETTGGLRKEKRLRDAQFSRNNLWLVQTHRCIQGDQCPTKLI